MSLCKMAAYKFHQNQIEHVLKRILLNYDNSRQNKFIFKQFSMKVNIFLKNFLRLPRIGYIAIFIYIYYKK